MTMRERLLSVAKDYLKEEMESSKDIIAKNTVPGGFNDMGMANVNPGEFSQEEITDQQNLVNTGKMSNDTDFEGKSDNCGACEEIEKAENLMNDLVDISEPDMSVEVVKTVEKDDCEHNPLHKLFHGSKFGEAVEKVLAGKSCRDILVEAGDYAGPLDFIPDTRINVSDVIKTLKNKIGEGSEGIHVDQVYDEQKNNAYKVSQVDKNKLPKKIQVQNVLLELDGDTYKVNKLSDSFPLAR